MAVKLGQTDIADAKLGTTQVNKIYLGSTEVWSNTPTPAIKALKFTSTGAQTLGVKANSLGSMNPNFEYSLDAGATWTSWSIGSPVSFGSGTDLYLRGTNTVITAGANSCTNFVFSTASPVACSGNAMHLFDYTQDLTAFPTPPSGTTQAGLRQLFQNCTVLTTAPNLPATTLVASCYRGMFSGCTSLVSGPSSLPATTLASSCYDAMFSSCSSLATPPTISATTLASNCCQNMFRLCTSLATAPALPATTTFSGCYNSMFKSCSALVTPPILPATIMSSSCYNSMFMDCTSLASLPYIGLAGSLVTGCLNNMFYGCTNIKVSETQSSEYQNEYALSDVPTTSNAQNMFTGTGGTFADTPTVQTYYTSNQIVGAPTV